MADASKLGTEWPQPGTRVWVIEGPDVRPDEVRMAFGCIVWLAWRDYCAPKDRLFPSEAAARQAIVAEMEDLKRYHRARLAELEAKGHDKHD